MLPLFNYPSCLAFSLILGLTFVVELVGNPLNISVVLAQSLTERQQKAEARQLQQKGVEQLNQGNFQKALEIFQEVLIINREIGNRAGEGDTLNNIGEVYRNLGQYSRALDFYNQSLEIARETNFRAAQAITLSNIGIIYFNLGQNPQALDVYQQALQIQLDIGFRAAAAKTLNNVGVVYRSLRDYSKALEFYQKALAIRREVGDKAGEGTTLNNIGLVYNELGEYEKSLEFYQQALAIRQQVDDKAGEGSTLNNMGSVYYKLGEYPKALELYQQALSITDTIGSRECKRAILSNMGSLFEEENQPELAIVFYKQSVKVTEAIRKDLQVLPREQQESYTQTVAETYRALTNLLLSQGRILEAQQVLELLKVQELRDFTQNTRAGGETAELAFNKTEEKIVQAHGSLIAFGQQLDACQKSRCSELSQLLDRRDALTQQYNQTLQRLAKEIRDRRSQDEAFFDPSKLSKAREIVEAQPGSVLIYPLVLENKIWLIWAAQGGIVKSIEVDKVGQRQLGETILKFRQLLQTPSSNLVQLKATGKQLYDWLIQPLEPELKANKIQNLVFSLDRVTRYIPTSALFDGKNYLIENYSISTILSADLTDVRDRLPPGTQNTSVLALGLSEAIAGFDALPNVPAELNVVVRRQPMDEQGVYPGLEFLNQEFDYRALRDNLLGKKILHIATHGEFVPGRPEDSYLLLGTGEKLTIPRIETLQDLNDVHLVVLSACETALGGADSDGVEIAGISYYFLNRGAKAVMASLWKVNDSSTSQLMQAFYSSLANSTAQDPVTKAAALQQAQLSLLYGNTLPRNVDNRSIGEISKPDSPPAATARTGKKFAHPYYWAPFILIGNGL